jgi:hypothetical protein
MIFFPCCEDISYLIAYKFSIGYQIPILFIEIFYFYHYLLISIVLLPFIHTFLWLWKSGWFLFFIYSLNIEEKTKWWHIYLFFSCFYRVIFCLHIWRISLLVNLQSQYEKIFLFFCFLDSTHAIMIIIISIHINGNSPW